MVLGCSKSPAPPPAADSGPGAEPPHVVYLADLSAEGNPYPDDRLRDGGGLLIREGAYRDFVPATSRTRLMGTLQTSNTASWATAAGHGLSGPTLFTVTDPVAPASLPGRVKFVTQTDQGLAVQAGVATAVETGTGHVLSVRPVLPLQEGGRPTELVLLKGIEVADGGGPLERGFDFAAHLPTLAPVAAALGVAPDDILLQVELQPVDATSELAAIGAWARRDDPVAYAIHLADGGNDRGLELGTWWADDGGVGAFSDALLRAPAAPGFADVGGVILGTYQSHDLRQAVTDPTNGHLLSDGFKAGWVASPGDAPEVTLKFVLLLPKGPPPYKVIIGGHGLGGRNTLGSESDTPFCFELAELFARQGFGCLGIDAVAHGSRGSFTDLFDVQDLRTTRDNFRQTIADLLQLSRLLPQLDFDTAHPGPDLDGARAGYFGHSLGSIMGALFLATDQRVQYGVLNVPTGGVGMMYQAPRIHDLLGALLAVNAGLDFFGNVADLDRTLPFFAAEGQALLEPADPFNYVGLLRRKHLLLQEGVGDMTLPNDNTDELFAALGFPEVTAPLADAGGVSGFVRVDPLRYGISDPNFDPHNVFWQIPQVRKQVMSFLQSQGTQLAPLDP
jgi:hypothetical protein